MTQTPAVILKAEDIWFWYDRNKPVLSGASLELKAGSIAMILGRSGCGKTTLLRALKGLVRPQKGRVTHAGGSGLSRRIAYIPQNLGLVRNLTALENALTGALRQTGTLGSIFGFFPEAVVERARATLESVGLGRLSDQKVASLSGGERQRVAIARALMQDAELILADEFVAHLDLVTAGEIFEMVRRLAADGIGFLITTHHLEEVCRYADEFALMRRGQIALAGSARSFCPDEAREELQK